MTIRSKETSSAAEQRIHQAALRIFARTGRTDLTVSELANEAGVARGTVYHHLQPSEQLFDNVATRLSAEMHRRVNKSIAMTDCGNSPIGRLAMAIRLCVRHAHEDPLWGHFIYSFGFRTRVLQKLWSTPTEDLLAGMHEGRRPSDPDRLPAIIAFIAGVVSGAIYLVATGNDTWRNAGARAVEFVLQALGVPSTTARCLADQDLPPLLSDD